MRAICLRRSRLSLVCVDSTFYPDGTRVEALTFPDNIAALSHGWDLISHPNASKVCMRVCRRANATIISVPWCGALVTAVITLSRAFLRAPVSEHHLQSLKMCSLELPSTSLTHFLFRRPVCLAFGLSQRSPSSISPFLLRHPRRFSFLPLSRQPNPH